MNTRLANKEARVQWLMKHWPKIRNLNHNKIALLMRWEGLYSPRTRLSDISISLGGLQFGATKPTRLMDIARSRLFRSPDYTVK